MVYAPQGCCVSLAAYTTSNQNNVHTRGYGLAAAQLFVSPETSDLVASKPLSMQPLSSLRHNDGCGEKGEPPPKITITKNKSKGKNGRETRMNKRGICGAVVSRSLSKRIRPWMQRII